MPQQANVVQMWPGKHERNSVIIRTNNKETTQSCYKTVFFLSNMHNIVSAHTRSPELLCIIVTFSSIYSAKSFSIHCFAHTIMFLQVYGAPAVYWVTSTRTGNRGEIF